jgi:hypothetical protein
MTDRNVPTAEWIVRLAAADARRREEAAAELFRRGCAAAEPVLRTWFADREFRALLRTGSPLLTVGIAVEPTRFQQIRRAFGEPRLAAVPPEQDAMEFELHFAHGVRLDVLTTRDPAGGGALARFLTRSGEGIQQVECEVRDVSRAVEMLRGRFALEPVYPEIRAGADGNRVNFFLVPAGEGRKVLIELVEIRPKKEPPQNSPARGG